MEFDLESAQEILRRTPSTLSALLRDLPEAWARQNEGPDTWNAFDVVGHLVHGERTDWIARARIILECGTSKPFEPFDRFAQFKASQGLSLNQLLDEFSGLRARNLDELAKFRLGPEQLAQQGRHPELGLVTLRQLLSTWVAHDLDHIVQVARVLAKGYAEEVGPWRAYLRVLG
jgi:hypothetical protein